MKTYLVGGAVRDKLLGLPVQERDWVVVGASPEQMLNLGYRQVGRDFPVFLHPQSQEEYALARTERKTGQGYTGFACYSAPDVTLEEDLLRRDLTINAMAEDAGGELIDPLGGRRDLEQRWLRHVSPAFVEDPLRVLRVARFAARFANLGFRVAPETLALMEEITRQGELTTIAPERLWRETEKALGEPCPDVYFQILRDCGALAALMPELDRLFGIPQPEKYHPEIDTGLHALMSLRAACRLSPDIAVRFAALIHDLGKGRTPADEWPRHIGHEKKGLPLVRSICERLRTPKAVSELSLLGSEFHLHGHRAFDLKSSTILKVFQQCDAFRRRERFAQLLLVCQADAQGRTGLEQQPYPQRDYLWSCLEATREVDVQALLAQGLKGKELAQAIDRERLQRIELLRRHNRPNPATGDTEVYV